MINYIKVEGNYTIIFQDCNKIASIHQQVFVINELCKKHLFTFKGYLLAVKDVLGLKYKIPLYLNSETILIPIKRYRDIDNIWINFCSLVKYYQNGKNLILIFKNNKKLTIEFSLTKLQKQILKINLIKNHLSTIQNGIDY